MNESEEGLLSFVMYWFLVFAARNAIIEEVRESDPDDPFASFPVLSREDINEKVRPLGENLIESTRDSGVPNCTLAALVDKHELVEPLLEAQCQLKMERREARYTGSDA
ncbi:hypothetical protein FA13DRAFT_1879332 [Coprinellus micaceus]|uniref:Uncharacterized protein n=1 Tax=Coprinellus micaceus TaxID=71717 RepID=A0A4Y7RZH3_COPMI|nr:hypothetical protein FA13DRAFT_1879332 [Coprinellus micaceus]